MKRRRIFISSLVVFSLLFSLFFEAFLLPEVPGNAAEEIKTTIKASSLEKAKAKYKVVLNGQKLKKKAFAVKGKLNGATNTFMYVPAESLIKKAGGTYKIKKSKVTIKLDDLQLIFTVGKEAYTVKMPDGSKLKVNYAVSVTKNDLVYIPLDVVEKFILAAGNASNSYTEGKTLYFDILRGERYNPISGGWEATESVEVPKELSDALVKANKENKFAVQIVPIACLKKQIVAGTNYLLFSRVKGGNEPEEYALTTVYVDLQGNLGENIYIQNTGIATNFNNLSGGWFAPEDIVINDTIKAAFGKAMEELVGVEYTALAVVGQQVVAGSNYRILCSSKGVYPGAEEKYSLVYIYVGFDGSAEITDIVSLFENGPKVDPGSDVVLTDEDFMRISGNFYSVYTPAGLKEICKEEQLPDGSFKTNFASVEKDMTIDFEISTLGEVMVGNDVTVTIEKGALLQAELFIMDGGTVIVKDGGRLWTTQAGEEALVNRGSIVVEKGGELKSMYGGSVRNEKDGSISLDGVFYCGSHRFDNKTNIWFKNEGTIAGNGVIYVYATTEDTDLKECVDAVKKLLPDKTKITVDTAIDVF